MSNVWERFDGIASAKEVEEAKVQYDQPEAGFYEAKLVSIEPSESKDGLPMLKAQFKTLEGGKTLFYNQMLQNLNYPNMTAVNIADAVKFVSKVIGSDYEFEGLSKFADFVKGISIGNIYKVEVFYATKDTEKKYPKLKIIMLIPDDNELPFDLNG
jgi:hypothetical protein